MDYKTTLMSAPAMESISLIEMLGMNDTEIKMNALRKHEADYGNRSYMLSLGIQYMQGKEVEKDVAEGLYWLSKSEQSIAYIEIGKFYVENSDYQRAEQWYKKAIEKEDINGYIGYTSLCNLYLKKGTESDMMQAGVSLKKGLEILELKGELFSKKSEIAEALKRDYLGIAKEIGLYYIEQPEKALEWLEIARSIKKDDEWVLGMLNVACRKIAADYLIKDPVEAVEWNKKALSYNSEQEKMATLTFLSKAYAMLLLKKEIPDELLEEALESVKPLAVESKEPYAYGMYTYYYNRRGTLTKEFFRWAEKRCANGNAEAQIDLAIAYLGEKYDPAMKGFKINLGKSKQYFEMAGKALKQIDSTTNSKYYEGLLKRYNAAKTRIEKEEKIIAEKRETKYFTNMDASKALSEMNQRCGNTFEIPKGYTHIPSDLLYGWKGTDEIRKIVMPNTVRVIERCAFSNITELEEIVFSEKLEYIDEMVFNIPDIRSGIQRLFGKKHKERKFKKLLIPGRAELNKFALLGINEIEELVFAKGHEKFDSQWISFSVGSLYLPNSVHTFKNSISDNKEEQRGKRIIIEKLSVPVHLRETIENEKRPDIIFNKIEYRG